MQQHVYMAKGIPPKLVSARDMTVNSPDFSVAVGLMQHVEAFGVRNPMLMTQITLRNVERRGLPVPWPSLFAGKASYSARRSERCNRSLSQRNGL
jgi:hypothetical protein